MKCFLTGSRRYGTPRDDSDVDMVIFCDDAGGGNNEDSLLFVALRDHADEIKEYHEDSACLRYGRLNLIITRREDQYRAWRDGTMECIVHAPVTRKEAVATMRAKGVH